MSSISTSIQAWRELYNAAIAFKKSKCWDWMADSSVFGIQDPETGVIGYCTILGKTSQVQGLVVYMGTEGLNGYLRSIRTADTGMDCLMLSFEDRTELLKQDLQLIRELSLRFRGRGQWPLFRSYKPGYHPWHLSDEEVRFLTMMLQQVQETCPRFRKQPDLLVPPREGLVLVRVPVGTHGQLIWNDEWFEASVLPTKEPVPIIMDEIKTQRLKGKTPKVNTVLEVDVFYSPTPVQEDTTQRPYYPYMCLWTEQLSEQVVSFELAEHTQYKQAFLDSLLDIVEEYESRPREIRVRKEEVYDLFELAARKLDITLRLVPRLKALERAAQDLFAYIIG